jgi:uncharacterized protein (TIGR03000 family)
MKKFIGLAAFGLVALFVASAPAKAGSFGVGGIGGMGRMGGIGGIGRIGSIGGGGYIGRPLGLITGTTGGRFDWSRPTFRRDWPESYYYPVDASNYYPYAAYYPQEPAVEVNAAMIRLQVRSDARVWFEGDPTSQGGADRTFVSPSLTPGHEYVYHIRVQWEENGKPVEVKRDVTVHAGDRINLNIEK